MNSSIDKWMADHGLEALSARKLLEPPTKSQGNGNGTRRRRSSEDAAELKRQIREARRKNIPVKEIAAKLGITPAYVYQLQR
jgi:DNA-binding transcriptional MerR regulator